MTPIANYRKDVDGLRALAVLPVVLFHCGFTLISGGYVGVDVFFVISGFLITGILAREMEQQRFSIVHFYERRARRILPALFAVLAFCMIAGQFLLLPRELEEFYQSVVATIFFASNFFFLLKTGYFDFAADTLPLLHTWSLAVEEQFYIVFPLLLLALFKWTQGRLRLILTLLTTLSLIACVIGTAYIPKYAYYVTPLRAWELLLGSLLALGVFPTIKTQNIREAVAGSGFLMILVPIFTYSAATPFPGIYALAPVLGATFIIWAGMDNGESFVGKLLSARPVVFIGLISYSLYLWHWPIAVYMRHAGLHLSALSPYIAVVLSIAMATLSWRFVEKPFRGGSSPFSRMQIFAGAAGASVIAIGLSAAAYLTDGWISRYPAWAQVEEMQYAEANARAAFPTTPCPDAPASTNGKCYILGNPDAPRTLFVWADSFGDAWVPAFYDPETMPDDQRVIMVSIHGCPPLLSIARTDAIGQGPNCQDFDHGARMVDYIRSKNPEKIVVMAEWSKYSQGWHVDGVLMRETHFVVDAPGEPVSLKQSRKSLALRLPETMKALTEIAPTVLLKSVPILPKKARELYLDAEKENRFTGITLAEHKDWRAPMQTIYQSMEGIPNLTIFDPSKKLCGDKACRFRNEEGLYYFDESHLSVIGAKEFYEDFGPQTW